MAGILCYDVFADKRPDTALRLRRCLIHSRFA